MFVHHLIHRCRLLFVLSLLLPVGGCLSTLENGPDRLYTDEEQVRQIKAVLPLPDLNQVYDKSQRNNYITARMYAIDVAYNEYFSNLTKERQLGTLAADVAIIGIGAATTVVPGAATKAALGAATTALAGSKTAVDKDVLLAQTVQILQNQMEVSRDTVRTRIKLSLSAEVTQYTLYQGLSDLEDYYRAGTLAGALEALSATVGDNAQQHKDFQNGITNSIPPGTPDEMSATEVNGVASQRK